MLDPDNPRSVYVLCAGLNEIIRLDVVSGAILAFVRLRDLQDPSTLWPVWSMALNPERDEIYVVVNPDDFDLNPLTFKSNIFTLDRRTLAKKKELLLEGLSIWELVGPGRRSIRLRDRFQQGGGPHHRYGHRDRNVSLCDSGRTGGAFTSGKPCAKPPLRGGMAGRIRQHRGVRLQIRSIRAEVEMPST